MPTQTTNFHRLTATVFLSIILATTISLPAQAEECASSWTKVLDGGIIDAFYGVTNNGSTFVAVGTAGENFTSTNGTNWIRGGQLLRNHAGLLAPHYAICYGNGLFVAAGWKRAVHTSPNGINWTFRNPGTADDKDLYAAAYDPDTPQYVVAGADGYGSTSPDGVTWTMFQSGTLGFRAITYRNGTYIAACGSGRVAKSTNGRNWTSTKINAAGKHLMCAASGEVNGTDMFVVAGGSGVLYTSTDNGSSWQLRTTPANLTYLYGATFTGTHFVIACAAEGTTYNYCPILTSPDGITWTIRNSQALKANCAWLYGVTSMDNATGSNVVAVGHQSHITRSDCSFAPTISQHPLSQTVCQGTPCQLCVTATGSEPFSYQWQKYNLGSWPDVPGAQSDCYTIDPVMSGGQYRCKVSNTYGDTYSNSASISIKIAPSTFSQQPVSQDVCQYESVEFCATAGNGSWPVMYQWQRKVGETWENITDPTLVTCYSIAEAAPTDAGDYRCIISNDCGSATSDVASLAVTPKLYNSIADFDCDDDVDQADFGRFQICLSGQGTPPADPTCLEADLSGDNDVDDEDFTIFLGCAAGPNVQPGC